MTFDYILISVFKTVESLEITRNETLSFNSHVVQFMQSHSLPNHCWWWNCIAWACSISVGAGLDYCNLILYRTFAGYLNRMQRVINKLVWKVMGPRSELSDSSILMISSYLESPSISSFRFLKQLPLKKLISHCSACSPDLHHWFYFFIFGIWFYWHLGCYQLGINIHNHHHHWSNVHFLPRLIKGMDGCFPTALGRQSTFSKILGPLV